MTGTTTQSTPAAMDLRNAPVEDVLDRVGRSLDLGLDSTRTVLKRRSIGAATDRGTWVRIESRPFAKFDGAQGSQGWGTEASQSLTGVARPEWFAGVSWRDPERGVVWRADETALVPGETIRRGGVLKEDPQLSDQWWNTLGESMDALAAHPTTRVATPDSSPMTQERVTASIERAFPGQVDSTIAEWATAHADFFWTNLTAPACWILDWEDFGTSPRGLDSASLWFASLAVPGLAQKVHQVRRDDLESRTGRIMALMYCARLIAGGDDTEPQLPPAKIAADHLLAVLIPS